MLNINEKILDDLNESEYFLLSTIARYGKKSCPSNSVLKTKTKWGINKVQNTKKSLIEKGILISSIRWKELDGKQVRDSNEYKINSKLISKYNGKKEQPELSHFDVVEIKVHENKVHEFEIHEFEVHENKVGNKVLKVSIIESIKLLNKESVKAHTQEIENLKSELEKIKLENESLKTDLKNKEKSSAKKESEKLEVPPTEEEFLNEYNLGYIPQFEIYLVNYPFDGWSEELKDIFQRYCLSREKKEKEKNPRYSYNESQIKENLRMIDASIFQYGLKITELAVEEAISPAWVNFFPQRIKNNLERERIKKEQSANNGKPESKFGKFGKAFLSDGGK